MVIVLELSKSLLIFPGFMFYYGCESLMSETADSYTTFNTPCDKLHDARADEFSFIPPFPHWLLNYSQYDLLTINFFWENNFFCSSNSVSLLFWAIQFQYLFQSSLRC